MACVPVGPGGTPGNTPKVTPGRFYLRRKIVDDASGKSAQENIGKLEKLRDKLETLVEGHVTSTERLTELALESRILQMSSEDYRENAEELEELANLAKQLKYSVTGRGELTEDAVEAQQRNLTLGEAVFHTSVVSHQGRVSKVSEDNACVKSWSVVTVPHSDYPCVRIAHTYKTLESPATRASLPTIHNLRLRLEGLEADTDLTEAVHFCQKNTELQLFTRLIRDYLPLENARSALLQKAETHPGVYHKSTNLLEFRNSENNTLVHLCYSIVFDVNQLGWKLDWACQFTEAGRTAALACHLPEQLLRQGKNSDWSVEYAIDNLAKLAKLDVATPVKSHPARPPKRKLN